MAPEGLLTRRLGSVPRAAASRVNAVAMCPALGSPGKSAVMRQTLSGLCSGSSLPASSLIGFLIATAVDGAVAALAAGPEAGTQQFRGASNVAAVAALPDVLGSFAAIIEWVGTAAESLSCSFTHADISQDVTFRRHLGSSGGV